MQETDTVGFPKVACEERKQGRSENTDAALLAAVACDADTSRRSTHRVAQRHAERHLIKNSVTLTT